MHQLHLQAGLPSTRNLSRALGVGVLSHSQIHDAFTKPRLPTWGVVELITEELARHIPGGAAGHLDQLHTLWLAAAQAETKPDPDWPPRPDYEDPNSGLRKWAQHSIEFATPSERRQFRQALREYDGQLLEDLLYVIMPRLQSTGIYGYLEYSGGQPNNELAKAVLAELHQFYGQPESEHDILGTESLEPGDELTADDIAIWIQKAISAATLASINLRLPRELRVKKPARMWWQLAGLLNKEIERAVRYGSTVSLRNWEPDHPYPVIQYTDHRGPG